MKYYIIAGEASGDLHGSNLMKALQQKDKDADGLYTIITVGSTSNFKKRMEYKIKVSKRILLLWCILSLYL